MTTEVEKFILNILIVIIALAIQIIDLIAETLPLGFFFGRTFFFCIIIRIRIRVLEVIGAIDQTEIGSFLIFFFFCQAQDDLVWF